MHLANNSLGNHDIARYTLLSWKYSQIGKTSG